MGNRQEKRRQQREFLFVIDSKPKRTQEAAQIEDAESAVRTQRPSLKNDEAKAGRQKLISELREFGC